MKKLVLFPLLLMIFSAFSQTTIAIYVDSTDHWLVNKAAALLQEDILRITGKRPLILNSLPKTSIPQLIIIGSLDQSPLVQNLASNHRIPSDKIKGKWESFLLKTIHKPFPHVDNALVIAGSDRRGTAYGVFDLSKSLGVSPWYWWADVPVPRQNELHFTPIEKIAGPPAVKYRGFFINDEAPALSGWVHAKYGNFNHAFYEKVFELLLRLKANYLWPAMWGNAFNDDDPLNPVLADQYGIVMGTSHHEPMLRAQQEWKRYGSGPWDYSTNAPVLDSFWQKGIEHMDHHESIVTVGMRGDGDKPMEEGSNIALLEKIVGKQREILSRVTGKAPSATPQSWALYKEVQDYYDKGMRVPDDITLLLCDDNWGNVRKLPSPGDKPRTGGYGMYYHFDYVGGPRNYKWINTNPIPRVWEEMHLTKEYGADRIWIVNVGDIKPLEFPTEFFLDYAWDPAQWPAEKLPAYTLEWATRQFGTTYASAIADILNSYTKYNGRRKPELLSPDTYSLFNYGEAEKVVGDYNRLAAQADSIYQRLPSDYRDAYYELVLYPVQASANLNELYLTVGKNRYYAAQGRAATNDMAEKARSLFDKDSLLSRYYNTKLAGGKWLHMMDQTHIGYTYWQQPPYNTMPEVKTIDLSASGIANNSQGTSVHSSTWGVAIEGSPAWWPQNRDSANTSLHFETLAQKDHYIEVFNRTATPFVYTISSTSPWVQISKTNRIVDKQDPVWIGIDWTKAPAGKGQADIVITGPDKKEVKVSVTYIRNNIQAKGFIETDGYVSMEANHYSRKTETHDLHWLTIPDLGRTGSAVQLTPVTTPSLAPGSSSPRLEYDLYLADTGQLKVQAYFSPVIAFNRKAIRYGVSFDDEQPQLIDISTGNEARGNWDKMVADNIRITQSTHHVTHPGRHVLKFWFADPGPVLQKLVVDAGGVKPSYLGPPESPGTF
ncbi:MAG TPA: glycosyl hydrolase 115 family protein [Puia sp.]